MATQLEGCDTANPYSAWAQHCVIAVQELQTRVKEGLPSPRSAVGCLAQPWELSWRLSKLSTIKAVLSVI